MPLPTTAQNQQFLDAQTPQNMTDEQLKQLLIQQTQAADAEQAAGIQQQQEMLNAAKEAGQNQTNTRALHGVLDAWYGGNTAQAYQPAGVDEAGLLKALQESKQKLSDSKNKQLKELLEARQKGKDDGKAARSEDRMNQAFFDSFDAKMTKDVEAPIRTANAELGNIEAALQPGPDGKIDFLAYQTAVNQAARRIAEEKGPLNEQDVKRMDVPSLAKAFDMLGAKVGGDGKVDAKWGAPILALVAKKRSQYSDTFNNALSVKEKYYKNPNLPANKVIFQGGKNSYGEQRINQAKESVNSVKNSMFSNSAQAAPQTQQTINVPEPGADPEFEAFYAAQQGKK